MELAEARNWVDSHCDICPEQLFSEQAKETHFEKKKLQNNCQQKGREIAKCPVKYTKAMIH